jgi:hypothetical protein
MNDATVVVAELAGTRPQASALLSQLADDLAASTVHVDLRATKAAAPSFVDQLVRELLVDRGAAQVVLVGATARIAALAQRAAGKHDRSERLEVVESTRAA